MYSLHFTVKKAILMGHLLTDGFFWLIRTCFALYVVKKGSLVIRTFGLSQKLCFQLEQMTSELVQRISKKLLICSLQASMTSYSKNSEKL